MTECSKLESYTDEGKSKKITVLVEKEDNNRIIATRKRLLEYCDKCIESETCEVASKLFKVLTQ